MSHIYASSIVFILPCDLGRHGGVLMNLFKMGIFGAAHGWVGGAKSPLIPKICDTYPTMMKLGTVIPDLEKIQTIYESRDTPSEFC